MITRAKAVRIYIFLLGLILVVSFLRTFTPPENFPSNSIISIERGDTLQSLAEKLSEDHVIRSPFWFRVTSIALGGERNMKAGDYYLGHPQDPFTLAWRILHGKYDIEVVKVTVPEGFTIKKISQLFDKRFPFFDNVWFEKNAPEGFLFPDTYFVPVTATASSTVKMMRDNFISKIFPLMPEIEEFGKTLDEVIVMASIIEGETNTQVDREIVSGILWKRLRIGMPLQVDVEMKTYEYPGLPEKPINNPGILSIKATVNPTTTPYLYYLTGDDGKMYYSKTFEEHVAYKQKHIKR